MQLVGDGFTDEVSARDLQAFPIRYLGIPLSIYKLRKCDLQHLVDKVIASLPTWKAGLLTKAGRTVLVKTKMSTIPVALSDLLAAAAGCAKTIYEQIVEI